MSNPFELNFTEAQLYDLYYRVESDTNHAYDAVADCMWQATRDFARSLSPVYNAGGELLVEDSSEWEAWVEELTQLIQLPSFKVDGFDAYAYRNKQLEARLTETSNV